MGAMPIDPFGAFSVEEDTGTIRMRKPVFNMFLGHALLNPERNHY
jgi:hypothetical protein